MKTFIIFIVTTLLFAFMALVLMDDFGFFINHDPYMVNPDYSKLALVLMLIFFTVFLLFFWSNVFIIRRVFRIRKKSFDYVKTLLKEGEKVQFETNYSNLLLIPGIIGMLILAVLLGLIVFIFLYLYLYFRGGIGAYTCFIATNKRLIICSGSSEKEIFVISKDDVEEFTSNELSIFFLKIGSIRVRFKNGNIKVFKGISNAALLEKALNDAQ